MELLNTHLHELRIFMDKNAPLDYMKRWDKLKIKCENGDNKQIVKSVFFFQCGEIGKHFAHEVFRLAMDAKTVFKLVILLGHHGMIFGC